ncbi:Alkaline protease 2 [Golovinomyces cichoracearum]|uniref:Alkaline protease 2 n=1 Tax=Golovinomyces cichoracearum TaxID=62708 RepID=A0A420IYS2_9PEZI|nr:Alkaline protease 2 [Golovinomyces cichoracearum]
MRGLVLLAFLPLMAIAEPSPKPESTDLPKWVQTSDETLNSYIVVLKKNINEATFSDHFRWVQSIQDQSEKQRMELRKRSQSPINFPSGIVHTYDIAGIFFGYSGNFDKKTINDINSHPDVNFVETDSIVTTMGFTERGAPWGLARISHRETLNFANFNKYLYADRTGEGVDVYVLDTGINTQHDDFEDRATWGETITRGDEDEDGNGHGTHCSGTIAGKKYGVAKMANVIAVKVLRSNGSGTISDVLKGIEWATKSHLKNVKDKKRGFKGSVANMSFGGGKSQALDLAVNAAVTGGIHFSVAAGNDNAESCGYSPAESKLAVTVGATALDDSRAYFSNYGKCVDIFAPGMSTLSTWIGSRRAVNTISGTSMASAHVAGLIAYFLSLQPEMGSDFAVSSMEPYKMKELLVSVATKGLISGLPEETANLLAYNGGGSSEFQSFSASSIIPIYVIDGSSLKSDPNP